MRFAFVSSRSFVRLLKPVAWLLETGPVRSGLDPPFISLASPAPSVAKINGKNVSLCSNDLRTGPILDQRPDRIKTGPDRFQATKQPVSTNERTSETKRNETNENLMKISWKSWKYRTKRMKISWKSCGCMVAPLSLWWKIPSDVSGHFQKGFFN